MALKQKYPHLKICISLGGWTLSWTMSKVMSTPSLRTQFIKSSVDAIIKYGFDGFDLDWEYPGKQGAGYNVVDEVNDKVNVATFFKELQKELQTRIPNKHIELSVASGANKKVIEQYKESIQYLDYFNLMTYDFYGSWGNGGHLSGLYQNPAQGNPEDGFNIDAAVTTSLTICPKEKLCIGVPFYARGWQSLQKDPNNPDAPIIFGVSTQGPGVTKSQNAGGEPGLTCWKDLRDFIGKNNNIEYFDEVAKVPYVHNSITGETWSYDNPKSIQYKMQYLKEKDLAGLIIWQLSDDVRDSKNSLLDAINLHLKS
jgi:chitinase